MDDTEHKDNAGNSEVTKKRDVRLDNLKTFKPGESGNPKGRPKGAKSYSTLIREMLETNIDELDFDDDEVRLKLKKIGVATRKQAMIFKQFQKAMAGDTSAFNALVDREEGKPKQYNINENVTVTYEDYLEELAQKEQDE